MGDGDSAGKINEGLFTSISQTWGTPQNLFDLLDSYFHFELDAAADSGNAKCAKYYSKENSGLNQPWDKRTFLNPPYKDVEQWMRKACVEKEAGNMVVCLVPARTDTQWFRQYCWNYADAMVFIYGRLPFTSQGATVGTAPFPSVIVMLGHELTPENKVELTKKFSSLGKVVFLK